VVLAESAQVAVEALGVVERLHGGHQGLQQPIPLPVQIPPGANGFDLKL